MTKIVKTTMTEIIQGDLPKRINVIKDKKVIAKVKFIDGIYNTDDEYIIKALTAYGYKAKETLKAKTKKGLDD